MNGLAARLSLGAMFAEVFRDLPAKIIANKANASIRTAEGWKQKRSIPRTEHIMAMLSDNELCNRLLAQAGRGDVAHLRETVESLRVALGKVETL